LARVSWVYVNRKKRYSLNSLYAEIGKAYYVSQGYTLKGRFFYHRRTLSAAVFFTRKGFPITHRKLIFKGRKLFKHFEKKMSVVICRKFDWCRKRELVSENKLMWAMVSSGIVTVVIPNWAPVPAILAVFLKLHEDLDRLCKCKKRKTC